LNGRAISATYATAASDTIFYLFAITAITVDNDPNQAVAAVVISVIARGRPLSLPLSPSRMQPRHAKEKTLRRRNGSVKVTRSESHANARKKERQRAFEVHSRRLF